MILVRQFLGNLKLVIVNNGSFIHTHIKIEYSALIDLFKIINCNNLIVLGNYKDIVVIYGMIFQKCRT